VFSSFDIVLMLNQYNSKMTEEMWFGLSTAFLKLKNISNIKFPSKECIYIYNTNNLNHNHETEV